MATSSAKTEKMSKLETLKLLEKCRRERDEAMNREKTLRDKLRQYEARMRSTEGLKVKLKTLTVDNKELRKQVRILRAELGLENGPKFIGKTTKDIINDLHEKDRQYCSLVEKTGKMSLTIDDMTAELANTVTSKTLLEDQVHSLQQNLKDMTHNQRRLLKLWEDKKSQREQLSLPAISQRPGQKPAICKAVQTEMSINPYQKLPVNAFETKAFRRDSKTLLDKHSFATLGNGNLHHPDKKAFIHDEPKGIDN